MKLSIYLYFLLVLFSCNFSVAKELLRDPAFENSFTLSAVNTDRKPLWVKNIFVKDDRSKPVWKLAQWGTKFDLNEAKQLSSNGNYSCFNQAKKVSLENINGEKTLTFYVDGEREFSGRARKRGEYWPHMFLKQDFSPLVKLNKIESFQLRFDIKIGLSENMDPSKTDPKLHTAQYVMYLILQDRTKGSEGFGDYIWFGIPVFDARYEFPKEHLAKDSGKADSTKKFIYVRDGRAFWKDPLKDGKWHNFNLDILPEMKKAVAMAKKMGFLKKSKFEDIVIASMSTGWEVSGSYVAQSSIKNISMDFTYANENN